MCVAGRKGDIGEYCRNRAKASMASQRLARQNIGAHFAQMAGDKTTGTKRPVRSVRRMLGLGAVGRIRIPRRREADDRRHDSKIGRADGDGDR
jgi:hypothetical protein